MKIYNYTPPAIIHGEQKVAPSFYNVKNTLSFCGAQSYSKAFEKAILQRNRIMKSCRGSYKNYWTNEELNSVEGLQYGLNSFKGMNIKQIYTILDAIKRKGLTFPVVRGCYHHCAHCFLDAKAPIERLDYEDFHNLLSDVSEMYKRFRMNSESTISSSLFWDSDCSEVYLFDKKGGIHDLADLIKELHGALKVAVHIDTAGWNPRLTETQKRMERFVEYCTNNPEFMRKVSSKICLSINPFHSLRTTALKQKQKGNMENYNRLHQKYLDMVTNMLNTFAPLIGHPKMGFLCRAYPDNMDNPMLEGYKIKDMIQLKKEILEHFKAKYPQTIEKYPDIISIFEKEIKPDDTFMVYGGRDNQFRHFATKHKNLMVGVPKEIIPNEDLFQKAFSPPLNEAYIGLNGDFCMVNDDIIYKTNLKLNIGKETNKPMQPPVHFQIVEI